MPWKNDKDKEAHTHAKGNGSVFTKRRKEYFFCGFRNNGQRVAFLNHFRNDPDVTAESWPYPRDPSLFIAKVTPK